MLVLALLLASNLSVTVVHAGDGLLLPAGSWVPAVSVTTDSLSFDGYVRTWTNAGARSVRRWVRRSVRLAVYTVTTWLRWLQSALKFIALAALVALAETSVLFTWRYEGWRSLRDYLPLILFVYACLWTDDRVSLRGKILVFLAIAHGVVLRDLIPDRSVFPGLLDDVLVIVLAVHLFRQSCQQCVIDDWARKVVNWRERVLALRGA
jgi:uncharacterized membrane protein YkvA (DUF1232 family)